MAAVGSRRDRAKERFWREAVGTQTRSGLSIREFCRERQLAESAFYFWRRELRQRDAQRTSRREHRRRAGTAETVSGSGREIFVPVSLEKANRRGSARATNEGANHVAGPAVEMVLPSGSVLRWSGGEVEMAVEWIATLEARLC